MSRFPKLDRPLAVFDIESTGLNPRTDRIVEISVLRLQPDGARESRTWRLDPGIPIPAETTAVHGITDEMVAGAPSFADKAAEIFAFFDGCDLGGFGLSKLDIPLLDEEFSRCGMHFEPHGRRLFDALRVFHAREPRDLSAAVRFYCGEELVGAHGAEADAAAALKVLEGEFEKYGDLPLDPDEFDRTFNPRDPSFADREGRFKREGDAIVVNFGRKKGRKLDDLAIEEPSFLKWIVNGDFPRDTREIAAAALEKAGDGKKNRPRRTETRNASSAGQAPRPQIQKVPPGFESFAAALDAALGAPGARRKGK